MMKPKKGLKLNFVISILVTISILLATIVTEHTTNRVLKVTLSENYLNKNYEYAKKISLDTSILVDDMKISIRNLSKAIEKGNFTQANMDQWFSATSPYFNAVFSTDEDGVIQWLSPMDAGNNKVMPGTKLETDSIRKFLREQKPIVSDPYLAQSGDLIVLISYPIFDKDGTFRGITGGTVNINGDNSLTRLLKKHDILDTSSSFVVDNNGAIISHTDPTKIYKNISDYPIMEKVEKGKSGSTTIVGTGGTEYFAGYAYMNSTDWFIISSTPVSVMKKPLEELTKKALINSFPLLVLVLIITLMIANKISRPLTKLAEFSRDSVKNNKPHETREMIQIKSSIREVKLLYHDIQEHLQLLTDQNQKDGLTGLSNRRMFDSHINEWVNTKTPFALVMLDIDYFKKVNDTYGHLVGDDVLKFLAEILRDACRVGDGCFRYGGEEFVLLLKDASIEEAFEMAEELRNTVANTISPTGEIITISLGITLFNADDEHPKQIIERADRGLYCSKRNGRNMTTINI
ncbi:diguanylate cyclase (GGDEF)-like protein [Ureibacillus xyleni]|uniref:Diguanylate cyclase (GGDEF)-like protein n=1 Tax=Ureibacillus xyleni TaxID=614648 RepID=A0A285SJG3_9BACL|nr:sensor domain-containing diguanylate cyclase [Ureibacillus xyleni]SOC06095.1 diguanylate cyclase (GGDEF)-like protein [Ureibacillus xyleni]